jgi:dihydroorotase-like cyclic amidohydrolase
VEEKREGLIHALRNGEITSVAVGHSGNSLLGDPVILNNVT